MKVQILEPAYFNNAYLKKGEIVDLNIDECPSWAEVIGKKPKAKEAKDDEAKKQELVALRKELYELTGKEVTEEFTKEQLIEEIEKAKKNKKGQGKDDSDNADEAKKENTIFGEEEQKEKLDKLLNEAIEKGILIEDADKKSIEEQIKELEELLKEEK